MLICVFKIFKKEYISVVISHCRTAEIGNISTWYHLSFWTLYYHQATVNISKVCLVRIQNNFNFSQVWWLHTNYTSQQNIFFELQKKKKIIFHEWLVCFPARILRIPIENSLLLSTGLCKLCVGLIQYFRDEYKK